MNFSVCTTFPTMRRSFQISAHKQVHYGNSVNGMLFSTFSGCCLCEILWKVHGNGIECHMSLTSVAVHFNWFSHMSTKWECDKQCKQPASAAFINYRKICIKHNKAMPFAGLMFVCHLYKLYEHDFKISIWLTAMWSCWVSLKVYVFNRLFVCWCPFFMWNENWIKTSGHFNSITKNKEKIFITSCDCIKIQQEFPFKATKMYFFLFSLWALADTFLLSVEKINGIKYQSYTFTLNKSTNNK